MTAVQHDPKRRSPTDRLLDFLFSQPPFGKPKCEFCVEFLDAKRRIEALSSGAYQWAVLPVMALSFPDPRWSSRYLIMCFSNPDPTGIPNHICYCVPLFRDRGAEGALQLMACLAPGSIIPLSGALHYEEGMLEANDYKDWMAFWAPVNQCFWPVDISPESAVPEEDQPELLSGTIRGVSWKDSVQHLARSWAESPEELMAKILR